MHRVALCQRLDRVRVTGARARRCGDRDAGRRAADDRGPVAVRHRTLEHIRTRRAGALKRRLDGPPAGGPVRLGRAAPPPWSLIFGGAPLTRPRGGVLSSPRTASRKLDAWRKNSQPDIDEVSGSLTSREQPDGPIGGETWIERAQ